MKDEKEKEGGVPRAQGGPNGGTRGRLGFVVADVGRPSRVDLSSGDGLK